MKLHLALLFVIFPSLVFSKDINFRHSSTLDPSDYLVRDNRRKDSSFDNLEKVVDTRINIGLGSDCGKIRLDASLKASLKNIFDSKYFSQMGKDVLDGSWMLVVCYLSPNWCSILRHFRLNAGFAARMRQNQCESINKYIDSRVSEFNHSRQQCVSQVLQEGGNAEEMAERCGNRSLYEFDLDSWSGRGKVSNGENRLLEDSAQWARFTDPEQSRIVRLAKQFVGDTVVGKGYVRVEYGPDAVYIPPKKHLVRLVQKKKKSLCNNLLQKIDQNRKNAEVAITDQDLAELNGNSGISYIDRQTVRYLSLLPHKKRKFYCNKIAWALGSAQFTNETSQALNFLSIASQNPNLSSERREEILRKKQMLKEDVENIRFEQVQTNTPLNRIASEISRQGMLAEKGIVSREGTATKARRNLYHTNSLFYNCVTKAMCQKGRP